MNPLSILLLSHQAHSRDLVLAPRGEIANAVKVHHFLKECGYATHVVDVLQLFGDSLDALKEYYFSLGSMNVELARGGHSIVKEMGVKAISEAIRKKILCFQPKILFLLSWEISVGALFGMGIHSHWPVVCKLYVHRENENVPQFLFEPASLLITESLLGSERAIASGIPPWKVLYFPHPMTLFKKDKKAPLPLFKKIQKETIVIGVVSRLAYGKNCEYALEVVKRLAEEGFPVVLYLKGDFEPLATYLVYRDWLKNLIDIFEEAPWLIWDREYTPYEEMGNFYASIDIFLHLSGFESGSNVIVEALGQQKPALILDNPTNGSLFRGAAPFVKQEAPSHTSPYFALPDREDLYQKLRALVISPIERKEWSEQGREIAESRFSSKVLLNRLPLLMQAAKSYHAKKESSAIKKQVEALYEQDKKGYRIE